MDNKLEEYYLFFLATNDYFRLCKKTSIIAEPRVIKYCKKGCYIYRVGYSPITIPRKTPTKKLGDLVYESKKKEIALVTRLTGDNLSLKSCIDQYFNNRCPGRIYKYWLIKKQ